MAFQSLNSFDEQVRWDQILPFENFSAGELSHFLKTKIMKTNDLENFLITNNPKVIWLDLPKDEIDKVIDSTIQRDKKAHKVFKSLRNAFVKTILMGGKGEPLFTNLVQKTAITLYNKHKRWPKLYEIYQALYNKQFVTVPDMSTDKPSGYHAQYYKICSEMLQKIKPEITVEKNRGGLTNFSIDTFMVEYCSEHNASYFKAAMIEDSAEELKAFLLSDTKKRYNVTVINVPTKSGRHWQMIGYDRKDKIIYLYCSAGIPVGFGLDFAIEFAIKNNILLVTSFIRNQYTCCECGAYAILAIISLCEDNINSFLVQFIDYNSLHLFYLNLQRDG